MVDVEPSSFARLGKNEAMKMSRCSPIDISIFVTIRAE
jgi:hypothetical protein